MILEDTNCTHNDIDGGYSADISSIRMINDGAYLMIND
jgi:hypothetical protein